MEQSSYFIKLDDLDVNYFLKHDFRSANESPLWDLNARTNYREFQVHVGKKPDVNIREVSDTSIINYEKYKCTLCNIDVPTSYRKEHNGSRKHRTSVEIAKAVMERVNNNIAVTNEYCNNKIPNTYFCETCAIVVANHNKSIHESSVSHSESLLHDRLLSDMYIVYKNEEYLNTADFKYLLENNLCKDDNITKTNHERPIMKLDENENYKASLDYTHLPPVIAKHIVTDITSSKEEIPASSLGSSLQNTITEPVARKTVKNHPTLTHEFVTVGLDLVHIKTVDNFVLEVSFDNFNGLCIKGAKNYTQCRICRVMIDEPKNLHIHTSTHAERMRIPLLNRHCYRQIDSRYKHCVLCNENFFEVEEHKQLKSHQEALLKASVITLQSRIVNDVDFHISSRRASPLPSSDASSASTGVTTKKIRKKHARKEKLKQVLKPNAKKLQKFEIVDHTVDTKDLTVETKLNTNETNTSGDISKTSTYQIETAETNTTEVKNTIETESNKAETESNSSKAESNTTESKHHTINTKFAKTEFPYHHVQLTGKKVFCRVCGTRVPNSITSVNNHLTGKHHKTNFDRILSLNNIKISNDQTYCDDCKIDIVLQNELDHIASLSHKAATRRTETDKITVYDCLVCQIMIPNAPLIKKLHEESAEHKYNVYRFDSINPKFKKVTLHHHFETHQHQILCKVCDIYIDVAKYTFHMSSEDHVTAYRAILQDNRLKRRKIGFKCHYCQEIILAVDDLNHIKSERHVLKKNTVVPTVKRHMDKSVKAKYHCDLRDIEFMSDAQNIQYHEKDTTHMAKLKRIKEMECVTLSHRETEKVLKAINKETYSKSEMLEASRKIQKETDINEWALTVPWEREADEVSPYRGSEIDTDSSAVTFEASRETKKETDIERAITVSCESESDIDLKGSETEADLKEDAILFLASCESQMEKDLNECDRMSEARKIEMNRHFKERAMMFLASKALQE